MLEGQDITVMGGGIGGFAAATALAQRGARVRVLEQADEITEVGAGLQISPNGVRVLDALGLGDGARARSTRSRGVWLRDGPSGREVIDLDLARLRPDADFLLFHRADLLDLLAGAARDAGVDIVTGARVEKVDVGPGRPTLHIAGQGAEEVGFLVGADGLHSVLRPELNGTHPPFFTGQVAWRAMVPATGREEPEASVFMGPGRHMVTYPLRQGQVVNLVAVEERKEWAEEGWFIRDDPANLKSAFRGFCQDAQDVLNRVEEVHVWGLHRHPVALEWHKGFCALLGDAAHPTLPFIAQGAVMALEDAWALADSLDSTGLLDGPALYQARRRHRVERVIEAANKNARNYHYGNPMAKVLGHNVLRLAGRFAPEKVLGRFDWIYDYDVTQA
ncbi:FAD-dependent monooxygenase [Aliiroseovarius subalbicans]|uniref:FAD-dependent monooxygenase n=1 Tax=Aliiroseovarius subalbicans TaxID=2925840 RepID=UPI001F56195C|nr:FAD-dependent monooxygenase [Aliiroseovarius subalbicans]MCI2398237.1 FAD-dependent monooxygenase [Aliiroseovarius subalbicans]